MSSPARHPTAGRRHSIKVGPRFWALLAVCSLVAPILGAIWLHPWFVTQDGSIYLYNTHIILESLKSNNPFPDHYSVRWLPLPYWGVYVVLGALMSVFPERIADHLIVSITSAGFLACVLWLRHKVAGWDEMALVVPLAVIISINTLWLIGLYNFLFGAGCYLITMGVWWSWRDDLGPKRAVLLAGLLVAGYLCHPVSVGVTAFALVILSLATPEGVRKIRNPTAEAQRTLRIRGEESDLFTATPGAGRRRRAGWTLMSILPLAPLIYFYRSLMRAAAATHPRWTDLANPFSARQWLSYCRGANILLLTDDEPKVLFSRAVSGWSHLPAATAWAILGLVLLLISGLTRKVEGSVAGDIRRGWILVSTVLILCGLVGPDDLGEAHGGFLRERILLLGLATLIPTLKVGLTQGRARRVIAALGFVALLIASGLQLAAVWNYAGTCDRLAPRLMEAKPYVGTGQRVAVLIDEPEDDYRAKPLRHLPDLFGIDTGNVIWNNYGPALYYFPIQFRDASNAALFYGPVFPEFTDTENAQKDLDDWTELLSDIESRTDVLVVWGGGPELDAIDSEWFDDEPVFENDDVRVFRHR